MNIFGYLMKKKNKNYYSDLTSYLIGKKNNDNLWKDIPTATKNGITFTNNGNGTYTINGTATANASFYLTNIGYSSGTYKLNANNHEILNASSYLQLETSNGNKRLALSKANASATFEVNDIKVLTVVIGNGSVCNNFIIKPYLKLL